MRRMVTPLAAAVLAMVSLGVLLAADEKDEKKADKKKDVAFCPVGGIGHAVNAKLVADFEGGKISFCCEECPEPFKKNTDKFAANARHQLLATGQIEQVACPLSGQKINPEKKVEVAGLEIAFCCENCQGKVAKAAKPEEKIAMVFKASLKDSKAFKLKKKDDKKAESKT